MKQQKIKLWEKLIDFPSFPFAGDEITVPVLNYKGLMIQEGDQVVWNPGPKGQHEFKIQSIRLNPTLRFWDGKAWHLASRCLLIKEEL